MQNLASTQLSSTLTTLQHLTSSHTSSSPLLVPADPLWSPPRGLPLPKLQYQQKLHVTSTHDNNSSKINRSRKKSHSGMLLTTHTHLYRRHMPPNLGFTRVDVSPLRDPPSEGTAYFRMPAQLSLAVASAQKQIQRTT
jgi:hypothetical protein